MPDLIANSEEIARDSDKRTSINWFLRTSMKKSLTKKM